MLQPLRNLSSKARELQPFLLLPTSCWPFILSTALLNLIFLSICALNGKLPMYVVFAGLPVCILPFIFLGLFFFFKAVWWWTFEVAAEITAKGDIVIWINWAYVYGISLLIVSEALLFLGIFCSYFELML